MNISAYYPNDVVNGPGIRCTLFIAGCEHRCPGCYNARTWRADDGERFTNVHLQRLLHDLNSHHPPRSGLSLSGGDPLFPPNTQPMLRLLRTVRQHYPNKSIWCWTGYQFETLTASQRTLIDHIDVLVDGRYEQAQKSPELPWRGSRNQRVIPLTETGHREIAKAVFEM